MQMRIQQAAVKGQVVDLSLPFICCCQLHWIWISLFYTYFLLDISHHTISYVNRWVLNSLLIHTNVNKWLFEIIQTSEWLYFPFVVQQKAYRRNKMLHIFICTVCCPLREAWMNKNSPKQKETRSDTKLWNVVSLLYSPFWRRCGYDTAEVVWYLPETDY